MQKLLIVPFLWLTLLPAGGCENSQQAKEAWDGHYAMLQEQMAAAQVALASQNSTIAEYGRLIGELKAAAKAAADTAATQPAGPEREAMLATAAAIQKQVDEIGGAVADVVKLRDEAVKKIKWAQQKGAEANAMIQALAAGDTDTLAALAGSAATPFLGPYALFVPIAILLGTNLVTYLQRRKATKEAEVAKSEAVVAATNLTNVVKSMEVLPGEWTEETKDTVRAVQGKETSEAVVAIKAAEGIADGR
jgi:hypothetical protein